MNDPRGPIRKIEAVERWTGCTLLTLSCGHVGDFNQTFDYKVGQDCRCFRCGVVQSGEQPITNAVGSGTLIERY